MGYLRFARCTIPALLLASTVTAQSKPGISFDQTMINVTSSPGRTDSATSVMHATVVGGDGRFDVEKGSLFANIGPFSPGPHAVMIMRDGGKEMIFLNRDQKQYVSMKPFEMMEGMQKMLEGMGGSMSVDTSGTSIKLDSLGPGPTIDGHPTLSYRLTSVVRMTMSMMGERHIIDNQSTQEIHAATDLGDFADITGVNRFAELSQSMGFSKGYFDNLAKTRRKVRGVPLRMVIHNTTSANGTTRTTVQTIEARNIKRVSVPDSLFAVPAGYKPVAMPAIPGTGM
jgi:Domain of unknown function (DUF4412)